MPAFTLLTPGLDTIVNPHPFLLLGSRKTRLGEILDTLHLMVKHHRAYSHFLTNEPIDFTQRVQEYKDVLQPLHAEALDVPMLQQTPYPELLSLGSLIWQAEALSIRYQLIDTSSEANDDASTNKFVDDLEHAKGMLLADLALTYDALPVEDLSNLFHYGVFGEDAFERLHHKSPLAADVKEAARDAARDYMEIVEKQQSALNRSGGLAKLNSHVAQTLKAAHHAVPTQQKMAFLSPYYILPCGHTSSSADQLENTHHIAATRVMFIEPAYVEVGRQFLKNIDIDPSELSVAEFVRYADPVLQLHGVESHFVVTKHDLTQGVYDLRNVKDVPVEYGVVSSSEPDRHIFNHIKPIIRHSLGMKD